MKKNTIFFIVSLLFYSTAKAENYSIIFVHIGKQIPEYVKHALAQARLFNPQADIYLIHNQNASMTAEDMQIIDGCGVHHVFCEQLQMSKWHYDFNRNSPLTRKTRRQDFWWRTSERFFYLEEFVRSQNFSNVFHLENDVMLYVDLSTLLPIFQSYPNIAATFDADNRCIAGFMYFNNPNGLTKFVEFFAQNAATGLNDMQLPAAFKQNYGRSAIDHLPIIMPEYSHIYGLKNLLGKRPNEETLYYHKIDEFKSIFDAAALGQYLGGIDPWHGSTRPGFINETCIFNPAYCSFVWEYDEKNRNVPYILVNNAKYRINNLHIHCKNLKQFKSRG